MSLPVLSELVDHGIRVQLDGPDLILTPKDKLTDALVAEVRQEKSALIHILGRVRKLAGSDWDEIAADPEQLNAFAELLMIREMRERGIVPDHYTATTKCKHCGTVPIFEGCPPEVQGCPWCMNRVSGLPMPPRNKSHHD